MEGDKKRGTIEMDCIFLKYKFRQTLLSLAQTLKILKVASADIDDDNAKTTNRNTSISWLSNVYMYYIVLLNVDLVITTHTSTVEKATI